jgi:hypothetical protein
LGNALRMQLQYVFENPVIDRVVKPLNVYRKISTCKQECYPKQKKSKTSYRFSYIMKPANWVRIANFTPFSQP